MSSSSSKYLDECPVPNCGISFRNFASEQRSQLTHSHNDFNHRLVYCASCRRLFDSPAALTAHSNKKQSRSKYRDDGDFYPTSFPPDDDDEPSSSHKGSAKGGFDKSSWDYRDPSSKPKTKDPKSQRSESSSSDDESHQKHRSHHHRSSSKSKPRPTERDPGSSSKSKPNAEERSKPPPPPPSAKAPAVDYYTLIGIPSTTSHADILKAIKKTRIANHPDRFMNKNLPAQELEKIVERSKSIGQACDVLEDPRARQAYDAKLQSDKLYARSAFTSSSHDRSARPPPKDHYSRYDRYEYSGPKAGDRGSPLRNEYKPKSSSSASGSSKRDAGSKARPSGSSRRPEEFKTRPSEHYRKS